MKLNIFSVPPENVAAMKDKFDSVGLKPIHESADAPWDTSFYFSEGEEPNPIPWVGTFAEFFDDRQFLNLIYFGAYVFEQAGRCFVLTYGKSHFYVRPFCDHDFGIEVAKRIANENDIKQKASKKFAGKRKKEIRSYTSHTQLDVESGESVDYLQAGIVHSFRESYGRSGKFGSSVLLNAPIEKAELGGLLTALAAEVEQPALFALPRTALITDEVAIARYDDSLVAAILGNDARTEFAHGGHELVGVDFVFSGNERFTLTCPGHGKLELGDADLDVAVLQSYVATEGIAQDAVLHIRVRVENEGQRPYTKSLKESLDFIVDGESVMLSQGRWLRFNEDYIEQLDTYINSITIEVTEDELRVIESVEGDFNDSEVVKKLGYTVADKDFSKIKTTMSTPIEAWDLRRGPTVYAVKFGTAQKLSYVCDQAIAVLEIIRNNANVKKLDRSWKNYCLWLGFKLTQLPDRISDSNSIILKQKIEASGSPVPRVGD